MLSPEETREDAGTARRERLAEIRRWLVAREQGNRRVPEAGSTGFSCLDHVLGGGWPPGGITELVEPRPGAGLALAADAWLSQARRERRFLGWIDAADALDPGSFEPGVWPFLFWLRCSDPRQALPAADLLVRDGNLSPLVLDLRGVEREALRGMPASVWYRLQRLVKQESSVLVVLASRALVPSAFVRLRAEGAFHLGDLECRRKELENRLSFSVLRRRAEAVQEAA